MRREDAKTVRNKVAASRVLGVGIGWFRGRIEADQARLQRLLDERSRLRREVDRLVWGDDAPADPATAATPDTSHRDPRDERFVL